MLDINLGETGDSQPVARELRKLSVPFMFVTGYGQGEHLSDEFADVPRLTKPITKDDLRYCIARVLGSVPPPPR